MNINNQIIVSSPGKVILHGEHAVVYGKRAIAVALNLRTYLRIIQTDDNLVKLNLPNIDTKAIWAIEDLKKLQMQCESSNQRHLSNMNLKLITQFIDIDNTTTDCHLALVCFLYMYLSMYHGKSDLVSISVCVNSMLPTGSGLGSSAAFSTCLASSLLQLTNIINPSDKYSETELNLINTWAYIGEKIIHGSPSGIDNSVSCFGGALNFQDGKITQIKCVPCLKILLTNTKVPRSTKKIVMRVRQLYDQDKKKISKIFDKIEEISIECNTIFASDHNGKLTTEQYISFKEMIKRSHDQLVKLEVSHFHLENVVNECKKHDLYTKLTGAGGGGCAFSLITPDIDTETLNEAINSLEQKGYTCWITTIGGIGLQNHSEIDDLPSEIINIWREAEGVSE